MTGYNFHPEAAIDLDEIWDFIAEDNLDAADKVIEDILASVDALVPFPHQDHERTDLTSRPLRFTMVREYLCLCTGRKTSVGYRGGARPTQPPRDGRNPQRQRVTHAASHKGPFVSRRRRLRCQRSYGINNYSPSSFAPPV